VSARGQYGARRVGSPRGIGVGRLYHSVGDREDAVKQMALDWTRLYQDLAVQVGELTRDPSSPSGYHITTQVELDALRPDPKRVAWWKSHAKPLIDAWVKFRGEQLGQDLSSGYVAYGTRWETDWSHYEEWLSKLEELRGAARQAGFVLSSPGPGRLPETVWEKLEKKLEEGAEGAGGAWKFVKYAAWGVLGIGAVVALSSVAVNLRRGEDPADKYVALLRR